MFASALKKRVHGTHQYSKSGTIKHQHEDGTRTPPSNSHPHPAVVNKCQPYRYMKIAFIFIILVIMTILNNTELASIRGSAMVKVGQKASKETTSDLIREQGSDFADEDGHNPEEEHEVIHVEDTSVRAGLGSVKIDVDLTNGGGDNNDDTVEQVKENTPARTDAHANAPKNAIDSSGHDEQVVTVNSDSDSSRASLKNTTFSSSDDADADADASISGGTNRGDHRERVGGSSNTIVIPHTKFIPWKQRKNVSLPCIIDSHRPADWDPMNSYIQNQPTDAGLLYIKIEKAASSTLASVAARTAHALAVRTNANVTKVDGTKVPKICRFRGLSHLWSKRSSNFEQRNHDQTFLWTLVKDPLKREMSMYLFFMVDWKKKEYTEEGLLKYLNQTSVGYGQIKAMNPRTPHSYFEQISLNDTLAREFVQKTIDEMDFLGLVERMDESLVLLSFMLDLPVTDVLYLNAKVSGGYVKHPKENECRRIGYKRPIFPSAEQFLQSDRWAQIRKLDQMLYDGISQSIDLTIDNVIGRDVFDARLEEFLAAKVSIRDECTKKIVFTCSAEGNLTKAADRTACYGGDAGCGHECVDTLFPFE